MTFTGSKSWPIFLRYFLTLITWVPSKAYFIVDKYGGFGSWLKCAPGSQFLGEYENDRVIIRI